MLWVLFWTIVVYGVVAAGLYGNYSVDVHRSRQHLLWWNDLESANGYVKARENRRKAIVWPVLAVSKAKAHRNASKALDAQAEGLLHDIVMEQASVSLKKLQALNNTTDEVKVEETTTASPQPVVESKEAAFLKLLGADEETMKRMLGQ